MPMVLAAPSVCLWSDNPRKDRVAEPQLSWAVHIKGPPSRLTTLECFSWCGNIPSVQPALKFNSQVADSCSSKKLRRLLHVTPPERFSLGGSAGQDHLEELLVRFS